MFLKRLKAVCFYVNCKEKGVFETDYRIFSFKRRGVYLILGLLGEAFIKERRL